MTDQRLLRIGAFSRASSLSVKALRHYHEIGLLVPAVVDPMSGYRSYSVEHSSTRPSCDDSATSRCRSTTCARCSTRVTPS